VRAFVLDSRPRHGPGRFVVGYHHALLAGGVLAGIGAVASLRLIRAGAEDTPQDVAASSLLVVTEVA
jgi:hypothetical protein